MNKFIYNIFIYINILINIMVINIESIKRQIWKTGSSYVITIPDYLMKTKYKDIKEIKVIFE